jgi:outer membrane protein TolC
MIRKLITSGLIGVGLAACADSVDDIRGRDAAQATLLAANSAGGMDPSNQAPTEAYSGSLVQDLRVAVLRNSNFSAASARAERATAEVRTTAAARRPQASITTSAGGLRESGSTGRELTGVYGTLNVSQLLYDGGATTARISAASGRALAANAERLDVANQVGLDAAGAWIELWKVSAQGALLEQQAQALRELLSQVERMAASGLTDAGLVSAAQRELVELDLYRERLERGKTFADQQFRRYFPGHPGSGIDPQSLAGHEAIRDAMSHVEGAPAVQRAAALVVVAERELEASRARLLPSVSLQGGVNSPIDDNDTTDTTVGVVMNYPISTGGERRARVEQNEAQLEAERNTLDETVQEIRSRLENYWSQLQQARSALDAARERIELTTAEAEAVRSQLSTGQANLSRLISLEVSAYRARDELIRVEAETHGYVAGLLATAGVLADIIGIE